MAVPAHRPNGVLRQAQGVAEARVAEDGDDVERKNGGNGVAHVGLVGVDNCIGGGYGRRTAYSRTDPDQSAHVTLRPQEPPAQPGHAECGR